MANWFSRKTELINDTDEVLEVRVYPEFAPAGHSDLAISLEAHKKKDIRSTKFQDRDVASGRASVIKVERNNGGYFRLTAADFVSNIRLIFRINDNQLAVYRSRSDGRTTTEVIRILPRKLREIVRSDLQESPMKGGC